ncbi:MAG: aldo/keto reductase [Elusimicrobia bacterium]|nr:aldo/keto reductase [Elusimicrobiota bacterium]
MLISKGATQTSSPAIPTDSKEISADVHSSLRSLKTDTLDVFLLHYDHPELPVGPLMERLNEHVRQGNIRTLGCPTDSGAN